VNPLYRWTRKDTWDYLLGHEVPYNPLLDQGYKSIGCWPCTRAVDAGADERAGRWGGQKQECGIHTFMARKG
jgi:phosphoadenosine phosphosulfate reductase